MSDIEAHARSERRFKQYSKINLILRLMFHGCCFVGFVIVNMWGLKIWFSISEADMKEKILKDLKSLTPFFFTNWNFVVSGVIFMYSLRQYIYRDWNDTEKISMCLHKDTQRTQNREAFLSFQTVFLGLSLVHDILEWLDKHENSLCEKIRYWRDVIFSGMVVPFTLFVTTMFWSVYAIDRELVFPRIYDQVVPWWFNHCVHTNITIVVIIETLLQARRKPTNQRLELILYWAVAFTYAVVYYTIYFITDRWLYQVFGTMNWWQVCLYQLVIWLSSYIFYKLQFPVNRLFHGPDDNDAISETSEDNPVENKVNENDIKINETKAIENSQTLADTSATPLPKKTWSLKFRSIRNHFENSKL